MESQEAMVLSPFIVEIYRNRSDMECNLINKETGEIFQRLPVQWKSRENTLDYLSVSKIQAYEQCPACFFHQYMEAGSEDVDNGNFFTKFGSILHEVVEMASKYYRDMGVIIDPMQLYDQSWKSHNLTDFAAYTEGKSLIGDYFARNPVDKRPDEAVFIEHEWRGELGGTTFGLVFDYVGRMINDPTTGILKDYKTNRQPFTPDELEQSFQLRVYELVLRKYLMPDIKNWITGYEMFRFGWQRCPDRTTQDLDDAEKYIANIAHQIAHDNQWEEVLNNYCGYRSCRLTCKKYREYIENPKRHIDILCAPDTDIAAIERERKLLTSYEKIAKQRKDECSAIIRLEIERAAKEGKKLVIDGEQLELFSNCTESYRYYDTRNIMLMNNRLGDLDKCLSISKTKFDALVKGDKQLVLQLAGCKDKRYASPYITTKKVK